MFRLRGAKYVQSDLQRTFGEIKDLLDLGKTVLFSVLGQDGLRSFLRDPYDKLILCDLVCHGVPSPGVWEKYVGQMEEDAGSALASVLFRGKEDGCDPGQVCGKV